MSSVKAAFCPQKRAIFQFDPGRLDTSPLKLTKIANFYPRPKILNKSLALEVIEKRFPVAFGFQTLPGIFHLSHNLYT